MSADVIDMRRRYICPDCGHEAKAPQGLAAHRRIHNVQTKPCGCLVGARHRRGCSEAPPPQHPAAGARAVALDPRADAAWHLRRGIHGVYEQLKELTVRLGELDRELQRLTSQDGIT